MAKTTEEELKTMQAEVTRLQEALGVSEKQRTEAEAMASAISLAGAFVGNTEEQASGNTVEMSICLNPWVKDEKKQIFHDVIMPTYFYTLDLPAGAGNCLTTNGVEYYHGHAYEVDPLMLTDLKSRVAKCWYHEKSIHGENENAYRKTSNTALISAAAAANRGR